ncbi:MAG TPA: M18 family aminopeptidase, partial [Amnibacterium sp.]|nr:M18 family aminopeptidase [Amnibacterium sp.]
MDPSAHLDDLAAFVTASPSSYHAAAEIAHRLTGAGYRTLDERDDWSDDVAGGGRVLVVRDGAVVALALPED